MQSNQNENRILLRGTVETLPVLSHENHGIRYYMLPLAVRRLSGAEDRLNVIASEEQLRLLKVKAGDRLTVRGEVRTFNNRSGEGRRLIISVHVQTLLPPTGDPCNTIRLTGRLCKPPILRRTPLGRSICDLMLAVPRRYGRTDYLPVIVWGRLAMDAAMLPVSAPVGLEGRIQSREYTKVTEDGASQRTAYEVSVMQLTDAAET